MNYTLLSLVQDFCGEKGLPVPGGMFGSTETAVVQYRSLLKRAIEELLRFPWQQLSRRATFVSIAAEDQGPLASLVGASADYESLIPASMWNVSQKLPVFGPVGDPSWNKFKSFVNLGPLYQYRIADTRLHILPALPAGNTISFMYRSGHPVIAADTSRKATISVDSDTTVFPYEVLYASLEWRWLKTKGEPWENEYNFYMDRVSQNIVKDANAPALQMDSSVPTIQPGIWVPSGSWPV